MPLHGINPAFPVKVAFNALLRIRIVQRGVNIVGLVIIADGLLKNGPGAFGKFHFQELYRGYMATKVAKNATCGAGGMRKLFFDEQAVSLPAVEVENADVQPVVVGLSLKQRVVGVHDERKLHPLFSGFVALILVKVGGEVNVGAGGIEQGNELARNVQLAVPSPKGGMWHTTTLNGAVR